MSALYQSLTSYSPADWRAAVDSILPKVREIDRNALRIWFAFFPLELHQAFETTDDAPALVRRLGLMGNWRLADQVDSSHRFLFSHRYWPQVKSAIQAFDVEAGSTRALAATIAGIATASARTARVDAEMLLAISAVGLMTLRQAGADAFAAAPGKVHLSVAARRRTPHQVLAARAKDDWQGLFGFARGLRKKWTVTFDENEPDAAFTAIEQQEIATAAQADKREYRAKDIRCTPGEGPIPVECRSASCGTCWVGVLGGAGKLSPVVDRDERRPMRVFGYTDARDDRPIIRLACQARVSGAVSIVIPPWNGVFGKILGPKSE